MNGAKHLDLEAIKWKRMKANPVKNMKADKNNRAINTSSILYTYRYATTRRIQL